MKKIWMASALLLPFISIMPRSAQAAYAKGNQVVSASFGGVIGANDLNEVQGTGPGVGAAYRYYLADIFSLGGDVALDYYGDHFSEEDETDVDTRMISTALTGRLDFWPRNEYASYVSIGMGSQFLEREFHDPAGNRTETTSRGGYFIALGFEAPLKNDKWMWGVELRSSDPLGVSADSIGLKFSLSRRFGKTVPGPVGLD